MVSMPKKPFDWGDDLNDVQINSNPAGDIRVTVTVPGGLTQAAPKLGAELGDLHEWIEANVSVE
jgi:hypothetical protein